VEGHQEKESYLLVSYQEVEHLIKDPAGGQGHLVIVLDHLGVKDLD